MSLTFRSRDGFTLLEVMAAIMLIPMMVIAIWSVYDVGLKVSISQTVRSGVKTEIERAVVVMGDELRQAVSITSATATDVTFTADTNGDGLNETIQYSWGGVSGNPLNRAGTITAPAIHSVTSAAFYYYNSSNTLLGFPVTASQVKIVGIDVTAADSGETFRLRTNIEERNL
ncbi:MAG: hypothetical protein Q8Q87_02195 [Candidatus Omnitrophota bacterium]|nr:hypothetical protein [Candidatus Omnitrophota bacterium]